MAGATAGRSDSGLTRAAITSSLVAGIPTGLLARAAMAVIGAAGGSSMMAQIGELTLGGTLRIVIVPMIVGIPFAALILWLGARFWRDRPIVLRGLLYALVAIVVPGLLFFTDFRVQPGWGQRGDRAFLPRTWRTCAGASARPSSGSRPTKAPVTASRAQPSKKDGRGRMGEGPLERVHERAAQSVLWKAAEAGTPGRGRQPTRRWSRSTRRRTKRAPRVATPEAGAQGDAG